jgi:DNA replication protein DnaC
MLEAGAQTIRFAERTGDVKHLPSWWPVSRFARMEAYDGRFDTVCEHAGPVVVDDIGSEYLDGKGWFLQAFDAFIDARYCEYRPTLITTNLSAEDFKRRYSGRVVDRIREGGSYYEFKGESMRGAT